MESLEYSLRPLNWDLSLSGCPIFPYKWKPLNYLLKIQGLILITIFSFSLYNHTTDIGVRNNSPIIINLMMWIWNLWGFGYSTSFIVIVWRTRASLRVLLQNMALYLTDKDYRNLRWFTTKLFIHKLLYTLLVKVPYVSLIFWEGFQDLNWKGLNFTQITVLYYQMHDPAVASLNLYVTLLTTVNLAESNIINGLKSDITKHTSQAVYCKIRKCVVFKDNVSKQVSIFVCLSFSYLFVYAVCSICRFQFIFFDNRASSASKVWALLSVARLTVYIFQAVFLVFMTHKLLGEFQEKLASLADAIVLLQNTQEWHFVLDEIKVAQRYRYKASDFFNIDRNLLISFASSFISLTVLFTQLINQAVQSSAQ